MSVSPLFIVFADLYIRCNNVQAYLSYLPLSIAIGLSSVQWAALTFLITT